MIPFLILIALATGAVGFWYWSKRRRRRRLLATALSAPQRAIVIEHVPLVRKLPPDLRGKLEGKIALFLDQVEFIGCDGLSVTEAMRLSIAAQACLLVVNSESWYEALRTVLIYPGAFKSRRQEYDGYVVTERETVRVGESWARGPVILSWPDSEQGAIRYRDGHNVVLHEFAHQIDSLSGRTDGIPLLEKGQSFADWAQAFSAAYDRHVHKIETGHKTFIDPYAASGRQEFFAVTVELFFERPLDLKRQEPAVYAQLSVLFRLDPVTWGVP